MAHITVTPAEDDEIIVAGAQAEQPTPHAEAASSAGAAAEQGPEQAVPTPAQEPQASARAPQKRKKDDYHETTLEDLESTSMPLAQRVVIIAAVVCIIGALVYYFVAMR